MSEGLKSTIKEGYIGPQKVWNGMNNEVHEIYSNGKGGYVSGDGPGSPVVDIRFNMGKKRFELADLPLKV